MKSTDKRYLLIFTFFLLLPFSVSAQLVQGKRIEFDLNSSMDEDHQLFSLQENGVLLFHSIEDVYRRKMTIDFHKYDSTLTELWKASFVPEDEFLLNKTFQNERFLFVLFKKRERTDIRVLRLDLETGDKTYVEGNLLTNMDIEHFTVLQSKAFIGGKYNDRPVVVMFSFFDKTSKVLPEIHANHLMISEMDVSARNEVVYVMLKNERNCQYIIKTYSYEGKPLNSVGLGDKQRTPISGKILNMDNGTPLLLGNYAEGCSPLSIGIYMQNLSNDSKIQYIDFSDLQNFFSFMTPKKEEKIKEKIRLKKERGKEVKLRNRLLLHDIVSTPEGWILIAEVFYPEYKAPANNGFSNWRSYRIGNDTYNNFRYTHAILCGFDHNGKLLWDNSISLKDVQGSELSPKVQITRQEDFHILAYPDEDLIKAVVVNKDEKIKDLESFDLKTNSDKEKITDTDRTNLIAWYGQSFLAYGYQSIRKDNLTSREVFSISKLTYTLKNGKQ
ncbi:hypothetical protein [Emticicia sp. BO119]|uniref:hypothetical protein n=1 Tax=Emticicia sp. BO119 TaxID=2757768 RepID=UPI0015F0DDB4|nr:hypothetical protein [Emticicia sp. BO119]MBA4854040.1 hypothetical protein [Emticicia sp. BO119]